jgi:hypothetical protein
VLDAGALIEKHRRKGTLLDTNLLVLYLSGMTNPKRIESFRRTRTYTTEDYWLLVRLVSWFGELFTAPHILTQTSDLSTLPGQELHRIRHLFRDLIGGAREWLDDSRMAADPCFERLGLADAAIAVASGRGLLVVTDDFDLQLTLAQRGVDALNFNHIRPLGWAGR